MLHLIHHYSSDEAFDMNGASWKEGLQLKDWKTFFPAKLKDDEFPGKDIVSELIHE